VLDPFVKNTTWRNVSSLRDPERSLMKCVKLPVKDLETCCPADEHLRLER